MRSSGEYKKMAKESLKNGWMTFGIAALAYFVVSLILSKATGSFSLKSLLSLRGIIAFAATVIMQAVVLGLARMALEFASTGQSDFGSMLTGFMNIQNVVMYSLFMSIGSLLYILLIVPGVIFSLTFGLMPFIMADNPEINFMDALNMSKEMMKGKKMDYFMLLLSFIGWMILGVITFGLAWLYVEPYMLTTQAHFYLDAKSSI